MLLKKVKIKLKNINNKIKNINLDNFFKENCPDIRNSKIFDLYNFLTRQSKNNKISVFDPIADHKEVYLHYNPNLIKKLKKIFMT